MLYFEKLSKKNLEKTIYRDGCSVLTESNQFKVLDVDKLDKQELLTTVDISRAKQTKPIFWEKGNLEVKLGAKG